MHACMRHSWTDGHVPTYTAVEANYCLVLVHKVLSSLLYCILLLLWLYLNGLLNYIHTFHHHCHAITCQHTLFKQDLELKLHACTGFMNALPT